MLGIQVGVTGGVDSGHIVAASLTEYEIQNLPLGVFPYLLSDSEVRGLYAAIFNGIFSSLFKISEIENAMLSDAGLDITAFSLVCGRAVSSDQPELRSVSFSCSYGGLLITVEVTGRRI